MKNIFVAMLALVIGLSFGTVTFAADPAPAGTMEKKEETTTKKEEKAKDGEKKVTEKKETKKKEKK